MVAYFSIEIGIEPDLPTYAGGLGVLADLEDDDMEMGVGQRARRLVARRV